MSDLERQKKINAATSLEQRLKAMIDRDYRAGVGAGHEFYESTILAAARQIDEQRAQLEKDVATVHGPLHLAMEAAKYHRFHPMGATFANGHWTVQFVALPPTQNQLSPGETNDQ